MLFSRKEMIKNQVGAVTRGIKKKKKAMDRKAWHKEDMSPD